MLIYNNLDRTRCKPLNGEMTDTVVYILDKVIVVQLVKELPVL